MSWGNQESEFSETVLLLSVAGLDVPQAHHVAGQHLVDLGLARTNRWGRGAHDREQSDVARILAQVIWPSKPRRAPESRRSA